MSNKRILIEIFFLFLYFKIFLNRLNMFVIKKTLFFTYTCAPIHLKLRKISKVKCKEQDINCCFIFENNILIMRESHGVDHIYMVAEFPI